MNEGNLEGFLDNLRGFFEEKNTFYSCEEELKNINARKREAEDNLQRLQKLIQKSIALPTEMSLWKRIIAYFTYWK